MSKYTDEFPWSVRWEVEIGSITRFFETIERAEKSGFKVELTTLPSTDYNPGKTYSMFFELYGPDRVSLAAFVQMLEDDDLMKIDKKTRGNMWKEINQGINELAEEISWL